MSDATTAEQGASRTETRGFEAEVKQVLRLMIHSLYSHREIFLRELISNASDACDKLRFQSLADPGLVADGGELAIRVDFDATARNVTITDNGIGLTRDEAVTLLGTIARSGTAEFLGRLSGDQQKDSALIGQFGVGFYSAFIVADRVDVYSRKAGVAAGDGVHWSSVGDGEYTVETVELAERGTRIVLHLKEDAAEFADAFRLRSLVRRYSDHIAFPVLLRPDGGKGEYDRVNQGQALWTRPKPEITDDEYREFYRHVTHDPGEPLAWSHNRVEGRREYTTLLYLPSQAPFDLWHREAPRGLKLYVKRVFILDDAEQFLPLYLRFVKGVVDSADLPLNVSRELLQQDREVEAMKGAITRRALELLQKVANDEPAKYLDFWREFGAALKEGIVEDPANHERIAKLLRFTSTASAGDAEDRSLDDYVAAMKPGQKHVYYLVADTLTAARSSPHLEALRKLGVEVLLLTGRGDEWTIGQLGRFGDHQLKDVARGDLGLDGIDGAPTEPADSGQWEPLCRKVAEALGDRVAGVRTTARLETSVACLTRGAHEPGPQLRRLLEAAGQPVPPSRPWLELNPSHPLFARLAARAEAADFADYAHVVHGEAVLAEGGTLDDPAAFLARVNRLVLGVEPPEPSRVILPS